MMERLKKDSGEPSLPGPLKSGYEVPCGIVALLKNFCSMIIRTFYPCVLRRAWTRLDSEKSSNTYAPAPSKNKVETRGLRHLIPGDKEFRNRWSAFRPDTSAT